MTALTRALALLSAGDVLERLAAYLGKSAPRLEGGRLEGVTCDLRPGLEEEDPSLSYGAGDGGPVFHRFGGDGFEGGAVAFLESAGIAKPEAVRLLIEWAGLEDEDRPARPGVKVGQSKGSQAAGPAKGKKARRFEAGRVLEKLAAQGPLTPDALAYALRGWERIEAGEDTPEAVMLAGRGLTPALSSGVLVAYRFTGQGGRTLPRHILPGAVAFELRGPDGQVWGVKIRNPGTAADLKAARASRYAYAGKGYHAPAWCAPGYMEDPARPALMVEGELNAVAVRVMLGAVGLADAYRVQGVGSADYWPHVAGLEAGRVAYLYADPGEDGDAAREAWARLCAHVGAEVRQVRKRANGVGVFSSPSPLDLERGERFTPDDACDVLNPARRPGMKTAETWAAHWGAYLREALERAPTWKPAPDPAKEERQADGPPARGQGQAGDVWETKRRGYGVRGGKLCALTVKTEDGEDREAVEVLADFTAFIRAEVIEEDGSGEARRVFQIEGHGPDGAPLFPPVVDVPTEAFSGMAWPVAKWGGAARVPAGQGKKDKARDAVQVLSNARGYPRRVVYQHTGWIQDAERGPLYLTAGAVIGRAGGVEGVAVELSGRLSAYALPDPAKAEAADVRQAVRASLDLLNLAPDGVAVPLLGAAYRAPLGPSDFVVWTVGETGRHKTAFTGLVMSHYGARWGRKFLPDGWNSSANALEANAFRVKDALFVIDDFKPSGGQADRAKLEGVAARVIQGAADGAGRGTLTADRRSRAALYPRGLIATSAEDLPRGHSNRARLVMVEVLRPLIPDAAMSAAYFRGEEKAGAGVYALALASFVQALAGRLEDVRAGGAAHAARVRELSPHFQGAHGRTGDAAAELAYGWEVFLSFAVAVGAVTEEEAAGIWERVAVALSETARGQGEHLAEADPVARALAVLSGLLAQGRVFLEDRATGGTPAPDVAALCGWARREGHGEEEESYYTRPGAVMVGYHGTEGGQDWAYFLPDAVHEAMQRAVMGQAGGVLPDAGKLFGNMRDRLAPAGLMKCEAEAGRVRYTAKRKAPDGQRRHFVTLRLPLGASSQTLGTLGTLGTLDEESTAGTAFSCVPTFNYFSDGLGTLGTLRGESPSSSSPDVPPAGPLPGPAVLTLADLEDLPEGEDLPGVVTL